MNFDAELRRTLDELSDRLREETSRQIATIQAQFAARLEQERTDAAEQAAEEARREAAAAAERLTERLKDEAAEAVARAEEEAAATLAQIREESAAALEEARREAAETAERLQEALAEADRLRDAVEAAERAKEEAERAADARVEATLALMEAAARESGLQEGREQGFADGRRQGLEEGRRAALEESQREVDAERKTHASHAVRAAERARDAIRTLDRARSLSEILDTLAGCVAREAPRTGVLLVQGDKIKGWRFMGIEPAPDPAQVRLTLGEAGILAAAVRTGTPTSRSESADVVPPFAPLSPDRNALAVPVTLGADVVAVVYADDGEGSDDRSAPQPWSAAVEIMTRHAARCLESLTATRTAQLFTAPGLQGGTRPLGAEGDTDHEAARRYARLLVSEIKLYHEAAVAAGRRERDLGTRLGGEIARARVLYEQRVPQTVRRAADHFQAELVRTLANGDASLLGQMTS